MLEDLRQSTPLHRCHQLSPKFPRKDAARGWISLFKRVEDYISTTQGMTPLPEVKRSTKSLEAETHVSPILDASSASRIQIQPGLSNCRCPLPRRGRPGRVHSQADHRRCRRTRYGPAAIFSLEDRVPKIPTPRLPFASFQYPFISSN